jgi:hypothetical protein
MIEAQGNGDAAEDNEAAEGQKGQESQFVEGGDQCGQPPHKAEKTGKILDVKRLLITSIVK